MVRKTKKASKSSLTKMGMKNPVAYMQDMGGNMKKEHQTFSHVMYFLFLISVTIAAFFSFQSFVVLAHSENAEYFYVISAIMMLLWAYLFWEFGHRIHNQ